MIQVEKLTKYYGDHAAIENLDFTIKRGEVIGFLGLNGAGKTTTLGILGCVLLPTSGRVEIEGYDVVRNPDEIRKRIGYLPDVPPLYNEMPVEKYLAFVAELRGVPKTKLAAAVAEAADKTGLADVKAEPIANLSHGYKQRVGLAQALVHNPALVILDEPTSGLDPVQIVEMRQLVRNLRGSHTVLVSSHNLPEISQTCDRLLVIQEGKLVAQGSEDELGRKFDTTELIEAEFIAADKATLDRVVAGLKNIGNVRSVDVVRHEDKHASLQLHATSDVRAEVVRQLVGASVDVLRVDRGKGHLESIFLKLTQSRSRA